MVWAASLAPTISFHSEKILYASISPRNDCSRSTDSRIFFRGVKGKAMPRPLSWERGGLFCLWPEVRRVVEEGLIVERRSLDVATDPEGLPGLSRFRRHEGIEEKGCDPARRSSIL